MIIDCVTYNGEKELFDLRFNILKEAVDKFIVVEFDKTFSGKDKPVYFYEIQEKYPEVKHYFFNEKFYKKYEDLAKSSPNTENGKGAEHWVREFMQKECLKDALKLENTSDNDKVFISDCDEIWNPKILEDRTLFRVCPCCGKSTKSRIYKLNQYLYCYYLNQRSSEIWKGTIVALWKTLKKECLNHARVKNYYVRGEIEGWHFTSLKHQLKRKLTDSYTPETYANNWVLENLDYNIANNKDFLGRDFKYWIEEKYWPQYLADNRKKYEHLCKPIEN